MWMLKGGECKTPITQLRGEQLKQPPVIAAYLADGKFPFTLTWPQKEVKYDVALAAATSEDRAAWVKTRASGDERSDEKFSTRDSSAGATSAGRGGLGSYASNPPGSNHWITLLDTCVWRNSPATAISSPWRGWGGVGSAQELTRGGRGMPREEP